MKLLFCNQFWREAIVGSKDRDVNFGSKSIMGYQWRATSSWRGGAQDLWMRMEQLILLTCDKGDGLPFILRMVLGMLWQDTISWEAYTMKIYSYNPKGLFLLRLFSWACGWPPSPWLFIWSFLDSVRSVWFIPFRILVVLVRAHPDDPITTTLTSTDVHF